MTRPFEVRITQTYTGRVRARSKFDAERLVMRGGADKLGLVHTEVEITDPRETSGDA